MAENLNKKPPKSILKHTDDTSLEGAEKPAMKWDEMNIIATHHPVGKEYGHMKIDEAKTPFRSLSSGSGDEAETDKINPSLPQAGETSHLNPEDLKSRLKAFDLPATSAAGGDSHSLERSTSSSSQRRASFSSETAPPGMSGDIRPGTPAAEEEEKMPMTEEERAKHEEFIQKRQQHYNEGIKLQDAKKLLEVEGLVTDKDHTIENTELNKEHLSTEPMEESTSSS